MDGPRRTESSLTGRPLGEKLSARTRPLADVVSKLPGDAARNAGGQGFQSDVAASLETIDKVTETYGVLLDKLSVYETKVRELTRRLAEEERTTGEALRAAARAENAARDAQAKAAEAEAEAGHSAETVRALQRQLAALRAQTAKLMDAVDRLFPDLEEEASDPARCLRVAR